MTAATLTKLINREAFLNLEGWTIPCTIKDARQVFGRVDLYIHQYDIHQDGQAKWVSAENVTFDRSATDSVAGLIYKGEI